MKIIILQDKKGFSRSVELPVFPPKYSVPESGDLDIGVWDDTKQFAPRMNTIDFYPTSRVQKISGIEVMLYEQM